MKRIAIALTAVMLLTAASDSTITVRPSDIKDGETKTFKEHGKTFIFKRDGDVTHLTIVDGGTIKIDDETFRRPMVFAPPLVRPKLPHQTWFECPKDHAILRVPEGKENETFKCPIDGTTMEKRKGRGFAFFFNGDTFNFDDNDC